VVQWAKSLDQLFVSNGVDPKVKPYRDVTDGFLTALMLTGKTDRDCREPRA